MALSRAEEWDLVKQINQAYLVQDPATLAILKLLNHLLETRKDQIVEAATLDSLRALQGECVAYGNLRVYITRSKPVIEPKKAETTQPQHPAGEV